MNIVSIMIDLIERQKITRRHSRDSHILGRNSLLDRAVNIRLDGSRFKRNRSRINLLRDQLIHIPRRKRISAVSREKAAIRQKPARVRRKKAGPAFSAALSGFVGRVASAAAGRLNTKFFTIAGIVLACAVIAAVPVLNYLESVHLEENLTVHNDLKIEDILYESLPSDYDGQGSGELVGIEPVLLTSGKPASYTVKPGDTLSEISKLNNIKIGTLISFNKITDVRRLQVGMELKIPDFDGVPYEVKAGDSLALISKNYNISVNSILDANNLDSEVIQPGEILFIPGASMNEFDYKKAMGTLFIYPTSGRLSSGFGYRPDPFTGARRFHNGIDLANATGTRVVATMSGRVADVGDRPSGYGKYIIIKHSNGYQSLYGHFSKITVRKGQYVYQGDKIGEMGNSGRSTGPHLHFSVYKNNIPVNPLTYLW